MFWVVLIFAGLFLIAVDRAFGLAFLLASFGFIACVAGIAGLLGVNLADHAVVLDLLLVAVFVPVAVRLAIILHLRPEGANRPASPASPETFADRNARQTLRGLLVASGLLKTFTTHFLTSGMILISLAMLARWTPPSPLILAAGSIAGAHVGGVVAEARGVTDPRKKINWGAAGLAIGVLVAAGVLALSMYWWTLAIARGEAVPW